MSRRQQQILVHLDAKGIKSLPTADIHAILRAADELIAAGGRSLLTKILKGSHSKDVLSHGLDKNPAHGFYRGMPEEDVLARIDWMILHHYLRIDYQGRLPMLVFTPLGWEIERENYACEIVRGFDDMLASSQGPFAMEYLKDRNRPMIMLVLDKVQASGDPKYLPLLDDWARVDFKKVQQRIHEVKSHLAPRPA
jgi:hypothetical protein